jgi:hypothetical protein
VLKIMGPSSCVTIDAMGSLLYEPDCSMWAGNPTCRQIDFDPNQCDVWFMENGRAVCTNYSVE